MQGIWIESLFGKQEFVNYEQQTQNTTNQMIFSPEKSTLQQVQKDFLWDANLHKICLYCPDLCSRCSPSFRDVKMLHT